MIIVILLQFIVFSLASGLIAYSLFSLTPAGLFAAGFISNLCYLAYIMLTVRAMIIQKEE